MRAPTIDSTAGVVAGSSAAGTDRAKALVTKPRG